MYLFILFKGAHNFQSHKKVVEDLEEVRIERDKMIQTLQMMNIFRLRTKITKKSEVEEDQKELKIKRKPLEMKF